LSPSAQNHSDGRLVSRPLTQLGPAETPIPNRSAPEPLDDGSAALLFVPGDAATTAPSPLLVMLHGAGGSALNSLSIVRAEAERQGVLVLAPKSRSATWDVLQGGFGPDVAAIDQALGQVFQRHAVDPQRVAIGGFSDGASYALTLGLINGDLFRNILAFSPGFAAATSAVGWPKIYISHGRRDTVLPFDRAGRQLSLELASARYDVRFDPFDGGHKVPADKVSTAMEWWLGGQGRA
jgi:phospholipase/carboxylesterase